MTGELGAAEPCGRLKPADVEVGTMVESLPFWSMTVVEVSPAWSSSTSTAPVPVCVTFKAGKVELVVTDMLPVKAGEFSGA